MSQARLIRSLFLIAAGAMPVLSIPLAVSGITSMRTEAVFLVIPLVPVIAVLIAHGSSESVAALNGLVIGLAAVSAYDTMRIPMILSHVWADFIPHLGGWVLGTDQDNMIVGYLWRYIGDGAGIGMAFFVFCHLVASARPSLITARPMLLSIGYGIFIWAGLYITVVAVPNGSTMLFQMTPTNFFLSLLGHLIYGSVLGFFLPRVGEIARYRSMVQTGRPLVVK